MLSGCRLDSVTVTVYNVDIKHGGSQMIGYYPPTYAESKKLNSTPKMYFRCHDCLTTLCTTDQPASQKHFMTCGICGGHMEWMGDVKGNQYTHHHEECVCNEMCQTATGPKCTCSCGGKNHGNSFLYKVVIDGRGRVIESLNENTEKRLKIAEDYRSAVAAAIARIHAMPMYNDYCAGKWIDREAWLAIHDAEYKLNEARKGVMQTNRIKKLNAILEKKVTA